MAPEQKREFMSSTIEVRKKMDLTQKQMAGLLGMTEHRVSEIERGVDGRTETNQELKHLKALDFIVDKGLLAEFILFIAGLKHPQRT